MTGRLRQLVLSLLCATPLHAQGGSPLEAVLEQRIAGKTIGGALRGGVQLVARPAGGVVLLTQMDGLLRWFSAQGVLEHRSGGRGTAPGRFQYAARLGGQGDSIWVVDPDLVRLSYFDASGALLRTRAVPLSITGPSGATVLVYSPRAIPPLLHLYADGRMLINALVAMRPGVPTESRILEVAAAGHYTTAGARHRAVAEGCRIPVDEASLQAIVPFCGQAATMVLGDGSALVDVTEGPTESGAGRIVVTVRSLLGDTLAATTHAVPASPVTPSARDSALTALMATYHRIPRLTPPMLAAIRTRVEQGMPAAHPVVREAHVFGEHLWVLTAATATQKEWLVFDREARRLGQVSLPAAFSPLAGRGDVLWGLWANTEDAPDVVRYRLQLPPRTPGAR